MKTILVSTSSLWNCGDDFIREGVLNLLGLRGFVRTIWWNRAFGVTPTFANDLSVNLPLADYILMAGTPEWLDRNEALYRHALRHDTPIAMIGVGLRGCLRRASQRRLLERVAASKLVEVCLARDRVAQEFLVECGLSDVDLMLDPAFFMTCRERPKRHHILCWRDISMRPPSPLRRPAASLNWILRGHRANRDACTYDRLMQSVFAAMPEPKLVVVHDNREVRGAESLFGADHVFYSSDYREILEAYAHARAYVGSRIHGAVAAIVHGAPCHLVYANPKARVIQDSVEILANRVGGIDGGVRVSFLAHERLDPKLVGGTSFDVSALPTAIDLERSRIRTRLHNARQLREFVA